jgi:tetratricopeptide (TPR) repeat protein
MSEVNIEDKANALQKILHRLEALGQFSAKFLMYSTAIGAITIIGGVNLPPDLKLLFEGIGINIISSLIERVAKGEDISDDTLKSEIKDVVNIEKIETLLTTNDFFRAVSKLMRRQDIALFKLQTAEINIVEKLDTALNYLRETRYLSEKTDFPFPPYIAHPYTLSEQHGFFGRQKEISTLTKWANSKRESSLLFITGLGGTGKSALAWNWFNQVRDTIKWDGMIWWSFYKTDASFGDFIAHSLAYISGQEISEIRKLPRASQEQNLINYLNHNRFLVAIDGLERLTFTYAKSALPKEKLRSPHKHLAQMVDERDGHFLLYLTRLKQSCILITSRLYPFDLCDQHTFEKIPNTHFILKKMKNMDALALWKSMGVSGREEDLFALFHALHNNPLLIKVLAASIMKYRSAPGDFEKWALENKHLNLYKHTSLRETITHILESANMGINKSQGKILEVISALRTPIQYILLFDLMVGKKTPPYIEYRCFDHEEDFHNALDDLEERGLLSWDAVNNVYDIHPLVRDFVWYSLLKSSQEKITSVMLYSYSLLNILESLNISVNTNNISTRIELFFLMIRLGEYSQAWELCANNFHSILQVDGVSHLRTMLNSLGKVASRRIAPFDNPINFARLLGLFTSIHLLRGSISKAKRVAKSQLSIFLQQEHFEGIIRSQLQLAMLLALSGEFKQSEMLAIDAFRWSQRHFDYNLLGWSQLTIGLIGLLAGDEENSIKTIQNGTAWIALKSKISWEREIALFVRALVSSHTETLPVEFSQKGKLYSLILFIMQGELALTDNKLDDAQTFITNALFSARRTEFTLYELISLYMQTEIAIKQGDTDLFRRLAVNLLNHPNIYDLRFIQADLLNNLAELEQKEGNNPEAIGYAIKAYEISSSEGNSPFFLKELERAATIIRKSDGEIPEKLISKPSKEKIVIDPDLGELLKIM